LREALDARGRRISVVGDPDTLRREGFDLVVNATPLGLAAADPAPLDLGGLRRAGAVLDLAYRPGGTDWVADAARRGIPATDGIEMLIQQGAAAFERWWSQPAPVGAMRNALESGTSADS